MATRIKYLVFADSETSFGLELIFSTLLESFDIVYDKFDEKKPSFSDCDFIFVSLIWWYDVVEFFRFCKKYGIKRGRGPKIIVGGISANPHLLNGYYDAVVLGDGEVVIKELFQKMICSENIDGIDGVVTPNNLCNNANIYRTAKEIAPYLHRETRTNSVARIEIARGCKWHCPFCQVSAVKPYREVPTEILMSLIRQVKGKRVGLFAPDRADHTGFVEIQKFLKKIGKSDSSRDIKFDSLKKLDHIDGGLTLGLEGLTESGRKCNRKAVTHDEVISSFDEIFNRLTNRKGQKIGNAQVYMILDFPPEREGNPFEEFQILLNDIEKICNHNFTLFLIANSFSAKPFAKYSHEGITLDSNAGEKFMELTVPRRHMKLAMRGGLHPPIRRIMQATADRGDEKLTNFFMNMANGGLKYFADKNPITLRMVKKEIQKTGWDHNDIHGKTDKHLWFDGYKIEKLK